MRERSVVADLLSAAPRVVLCAASATPRILVVIWSDPPAAFATERTISFVVAVCSSTAAAMVMT